MHAFVVILFRQNQRKKPIPADTARCGICLVFRVSPGTWRVNVFSPKFLTHLFGTLPDEREPHNLPWQCLGLGCCYFKTKLCSFQQSRIYFQLSRIYFQLNRIYFQLDIYCWVVLMAALAKTIFVDILVELTNTVFVNSKNMSTISTVLSTLHTSLP